MLQKPLKIYVSKVFRCIWKFTLSWNVKLNILTYTSSTFHLLFHWFKPLDSDVDHILDVNTISNMWKQISVPCCSQSFCHTHVIVLSDTNGLFDLFQQVRLSGIKSHYGGQFGYSINLTVSLTACRKYILLSTLSLYNVKLWKGTEAIPVSSLPASTFLRKLFKLACLHGPSIGSWGLGPIICTYKYNIYQHMIGKLCLHFLNKSPTSFLSVRIIDWSVVLWSWPKEFQRALL